MLFFIREVIVWGSSLPRWIRTIARVSYGIRIFIVERKSWFIERIKSNTIWIFQWRKTRAPSLWQQIANNPTNCTKYKHWNLKLTLQLHLQPSPLSQSQSQTKAITPWSINSMLTTTANILSSGTIPSIPTKSMRGMAPVKTMSCCIKRRRTKPLQILMCSRTMWFCIWERLYRRLSE